jgi:hypothetical protein
LFRSTKSFAAPSIEEPIKRLLSMKSHIPIKRYDQRAHDKATTVIPIPSIEEPFADYYQQSIAYSSPQEQPLKTGGSCKSYEGVDPSEQTSSVTSDPCGPTEAPDPFKYFKALTLTGAAATQPGARDQP